MNSVIVAARRSAVAPRGGALSTLNLHDLASPVIKACLAQIGMDTTQVDEIIVGNALGAGGPFLKHVLSDAIPMRGMPAMKKPMILGPATRFFNDARLE